MPLPLTQVHFHFHFNTLTLSLSIPSYISCSAVLVARIQSWSFFDAFYFCFMTLFTVGLGGLSPNQVSSLIHSGDKGIRYLEWKDWHSLIKCSHLQASLTICVLYIFIGLILVSTCWHIFQEEVKQDVN